jgi:hypothetical protein
LLGAQQVKYILPAHGYAIGGPDDEALAALLAPQATPTAA